MNNSILVLMFSYFMGLIWYRVSDYIFPLWFPYEPAERYWVNRFYLRRPECEHELGEITTIGFQVTACMYFMLTTLSTVGFGDFFPSSMPEKILNIFI